ncbi:MAG: transporter substrate-binding domain-containing protein, partial [Campylobacterales bacterium]|nr:transporter substrate-binding domain-containing protein [Campylobacterales bacterium]
DFYSDIIFTSEQKLKNNQSQVEKFNEATLKGYEYAFAHIEESVDLILKKYNTQKKTKDALIYEAEKLKDLAFTSNANFGNLDINKFYKIAGSYQVLGLIGGIYSLDGFIHTPSVVSKRLVLSEDEIRWLKNHPVIKLGIDNSWPPFEYIDQDGKYKGMAADYLNIIGKKLGVKFDIDKELDWSSTVDGVKKGSLNMFSCAVRSPQREVYVDFTDPYLSFPMVIIASNKVAFIRSLNDLKGKKVVVVKGYVTDDLLTLNHPHLDIVRAKNIEEALKMVSYGEAYAYVGNIATTSYYITKGGYTSLKVVGNTPYKYDLAMGVRKEMAPFRDILQKALNSISEKKKDEIYNRWVSVTYSHEFDYTLLWKVLAGVSVLIIGFIYWNRTLAHQIRMRKIAEKKLVRLNKNLESTVQEKIDELREKDKILLKQSQMAAMGEMIGVIAHQLKQPINAISLSSQILEDDVLDNEYKKEDILEATQRIGTQVKFMTSTIDGFRNFFNPNKKKTDFNVDESISDAVEILEIQLKKYKITLDFEKGGFIIHGIATELQQVIMNIVNNAKDALVENQIQDGHITVKSYTENSKGIITISDNGGGIKEEAIDKLFESYFSTKGEKGTGIGLYMVSQIVHEIHGEITAYNKDGGAEFKISFPLQS